MLRCLVMQTLLDVTPRENPQWEALRCGVGQLVKACSKTVGVLAFKQRRVRIGSGGDGSSSRRYGTAVNFERLLLVWPCGNQI